VKASDLNPFGTLFGGRLAALIDETAGHSAYALAGGPVVTIAINEMLFLKPVFEGATLTIRTVVNRVFDTSMEVGAAAWAVPPGGVTPERVCRAYLTFVAVDEHGLKRTLTPVVPESADETRRFEAAGERRQRRM
jgi:acyl-CoA hydrolase